MSERSVSPAGNDRGADRAEVYGAAAPDYFRAGWQPLPLPPGCKQAPPSGYTGADGKLIGSIQTIKQWARNPKGAAGNIALHLIHPFIGIDVDTYGEKNGAASLAAAEAELGPLPPTLISSARPDPLVSGIRVFRLPDGCPRLGPDAEKYLRDRFGADIDVISQSYRYIVGWPSVNPEALDEDGAPRVYRWYAQAGGPHGVWRVEVPTFAEIAELPAAWADLLAGPAAGSKDAAEAAVTARAQAAERAMADPFDPADAELDELGIDVADAATRLFSRELAEAEIEEWLARLRKARRGRINDVLKDATSHLWHFVPHFLPADVARALLVEAQRQAWVAAGGKDNGDYYQANRSIDHTVTSYVPAQVKFGLWWVAVLDGDDDEPIAGPGKAPASPAATPPAEADPDGPTEIDDWDAPRPSASSIGAASSGAASAVSSADQADIDAMLALREQRRREREERARESQLAQAIAQEEVKREARRIVDQKELNRPVDPQRRSRLMEDFLSSEELDAIEDLEHLIEGWIWKDSLSQIFGPSGHYKSFVAADMARAVCTGEMWHGHETSKGRVLYICAEGVRGFKKRIRAMESARNLGRLADLTVLKRAVQIGGPEWPEFIDICREYDYSMIIVDTQARTTVGRNENASDDMGIVVDALDLLISRTGAGVVMIHHSGKGEAADGRGSSAVKGALQSQIRVRRRDQLTVEISQLKQKDDAEIGPYYLQLVPHLDSLVIEADRVADGMSPDRSEQRAAEQRKLAHQVDANDLAAMDTRPAVARVLAAVFGGGDGATKAELKAAYNGFLAEAGQPPVKAQTFGSTWTKLSKDGHLSRNPHLRGVVLSHEGCKTFGVPFERPGWVSEDEWEEAIAEGALDPAVLLAGVAEGPPGGAVADDLDGEPYDEFDFE